MKQVNMTIFDKLREQGLDPYKSDEVSAHFGVDLEKIREQIPVQVEEVLEVEEKQEHASINQINLNGNPNARDLELMEKYKLEDPDWFARVSANLEFHNDYITVNLPKNGEFKLDREDLGIMNWDKAMKKSKKIGKRLPSKEEYEEFIYFLGLDKSREIFELTKNSYWSSTSDVDDVTYACYLNFSYGPICHFNKNGDIYFRCTR